MITITLIFTLIACYGALAFLILGIALAKKQAETQEEIWRQFYEKE